MRYKISFAILFSITSLNVPAISYAEQSFRLVVEQPDLVNKESANKEASVIIHQKVKRWKDSWQNKNLSAYFGSYSAVFKPYGGQSKDEWEKSREHIILGSEDISIQLNNINVAANVEKNSAIVTFDQTYKSNIHQDNIKKQLTYIRKNGDWLIASEKQI